MDDVETPGAELEERGDAVPVGKGGEDGVGD
jgi:hypothetical protein